MKLNQLKQISALRRLNTYLGIAIDCQKQNQEKISIRQIADKTGMSMESVKEDLMFLMVSNNSGEEYSVDDLTAALERNKSFLGNQVEAVLVAEGLLGKVLLKTNGFSGPGVKTMAIFCDGADLNSSHCGIPCFAIEKAGSLSRRLNVQLGIICVPHKLAQAYADLLIKSGVTGIWNWSGCDIEVPENVAVLREDNFGAELGIV